MSIAIVVAGADAGAAVLARHLSLPLVADPAALPPGCIAYLSYRDGCLQLFPADSRQSGPVQVDFAAAGLVRRARAGGELIVKAVKGRSRGDLHVVDATAGLGRDAFVLAAHGFEVTLVERDAVAAALLADGLSRAMQSPVAAIAARMRLHRGEAAAYCAGLDAARRPDVVYLDPMFVGAATEQKGAAQVKKAMRLFRQFLGGDDGGNERGLLDAARAAARLRVVVKRALKAPNFAGVDPAYALRGKAVRFDVYPL